MKKAPIKEWGWKSKRAMTIVLEINDIEIVDIAWLRKKTIEKRNIIINITEFCAMLEEVNLALRWGLKIEI